MPDKKTILWVEDDPYYSAQVRPALEIAGFCVLEALNAQAAIEIVKVESHRIDLIILDVAMPHGNAFNDLVSKGGHETGLLLGVWLHDQYPAIPLIGFSLNTSPETERWFLEYGLGYFRKGMEQWTLVEFVKRKLGTGHLRTRGPRVFIVHGHDDEPVAELKTLLIDALGFNDIIILRDLPSQGRTIIEKFEKSAESIDIVFVILTPDDLAFPRNDPKEMKGRARQNVVFELGYFYAKLQRTKGRVAVLCKGEVERPSDIGGIDYIDITRGVAPAADKIKQELSAWLT